MSAVDAYVAGSQREAGDRIYAAMLAGGATREEASEAAACAADAERTAAMLDFYGAHHAEDV